MRVLICDFVCVCVCFRKENKTMPAIFVFFFVRAAWMCVFWDETEGR